MIIEDIPPQLGLLTSFSQPEIMTYSHYIYKSYYLLFIVPMCTTYNYITPYYYHYILLKCVK